MGLLTKWHCQHDIRLLERCTAAWHILLIAGHMLVILLKYAVLTVALRHLDSELELGGKESEILLTGSAFAVIKIHKGLSLGRDVRQ